MNRWNCHRIRKFLGRDVSRLLVLSILVGLSLFGVELAFAYGLQGFLTAIGVTSIAALKIPPWIPRELPAVLGFVLGVGIIRAALLWAQFYMQVASFERFKQLQRARLIHWVFHSQSASTSKVMTLFNEYMNASGLAIMSLQGAVVQVTSAGLLAITLFSLAPLPTAIAVGTLGLMALPLRRLDRSIRRSANGLVTEWERTNENLLISIRNLLLLQIYGTEDIEEKKVQDGLAAHLRHNLVSNSAAGLKASIPPVLGIAIVCLITISAKKTGALAPGILITYFYLFIRFVQNFADLTKMSSNLLLSRPQLKAVSDWWLEHSHDRPNFRHIAAALPGTAAPLGQPVGWDLRNIRFSYPEASKPIFENFNLQIRPGETLVIQGPSGGGKSTLVNLLLGNLRPQSGAIHVRLGDSEVPIDEFRSRLLPEVGYVGPECFLIEGTIYKNITYGLQREPEPAEVEQALRLAECQFVSESPEGLNKQITEQGQGLSAGQKQRLSLARALLRRPKALFLDEATSNLDHETEKRLLATLSNLKGHATMIVVTHRPSLLQLADQELRLE